MRLQTTRTQIRGVAAAWHRQYANPSDHHAAIGRRLDALDKETATAEDVKAIIGNGSWTRLACDECEQEVDAVVEIGASPDDEYEGGRDLCRECARAALDAFAPSAEAAPTNEAKETR
jgi:hypothetical protein